MDTSTPAGPVLLTYRDAPTRLATAIVILVERLADAPDAPVVSIENVKEELLAWYVRIAMATRIAFDSA
jgi:hypothetical protein